MSLSAGARGPSASSAGGLGAAVRTRVTTASVAAASTSTATPISARRLKEERRGGGFRVERERGDRGTTRQPFQWRLADSNVEKTQRTRRTQRKANRCFLGVLRVLGVEFNSRYTKSPQVSPETTNRT